MADNSHFYLEVTYSRFSFCLLVTEQGDWRFINASDPGVFGRDPNWQRGKYSLNPKSFSMMDFCTMDGSMVAFQLGDIKFMPSVTSNPKFFENQFHLGEFWERQLGVSHQQGKGSWAPIATGPFIAEVKQRMDDMQKEFREVCILIGLDIAAMVDPTGLMNFPAARQASIMGDYLGCTLNLLALIPIIGKAADAANNARALQRFRYLTTELTFLERWLKLSVKALRRGNAAETGLKTEVQGTTTGIKIIEGVEQGVRASTKLKNVGWVQKLGAEMAESVGMLPEELKAFQRLADAGYFFVARSCNPARVKWLRWAQRCGARILSKPMWIKWKTLKKSKSCNGLVGFLKMDLTHANTIERLRPVASTHLPPSFKLNWLDNISAAYPKPPKIYQVVNNFEVTEIEDAERMLNHYLVDMGDSFVLVDSKGAAYIGDIDIASIQRRLSNGHFGPPGFKVGPQQQVGIYRGGSDSAELESYFNKFFKGVGYPPGYDVFQHGGRSGSAGFFKGDQELFDFFGKKTLVGWSPKGDWDSEHLIVAVKGAESLEGGVGYTKSWEALKLFHEANPMGEFRFNKYTKIDPKTGLPKL